MSDPEYIGRIARSIAPCGLVCALCGKPSCKGCRESTDAELSCLCRQRTCCREKGFSEDEAEILRLLREGSKP